MKIEKILTDVPFLDEIVYYVKLLSIGTVLKNPTEANENETLESARASNLYLACMDDYVIFKQIPFTEQMMIDANIPQELHNKYLSDYSSIDQIYRPKLMESAKKIIINSYEELNNYYRNLYGLPNIGESGIKITDWAAPEGIIIDLNKYVHEMTTAEINILDSYGIIDNLIEKYPEKDYLKHLGERKISPYNARKADRFESLYIPTIDSTDIYDKYKDRLDINRVFTLKTVYSEAFKYGSDYYDNFIIVLIIIQTMLDVIGSLQEFIAKKQVFDLRCIQYIFQSAGIPFFPEIPLRYQIAMVKNLNTLIKYKSTTRNMIDICSLFGFDNIEIFKYYLLRDRKRDSNGNYQFNTKEIEINDPDNPGQTKIIEVEDNDANYELKFIRVPLEEKVDDYLKSNSNHQDYDTVTSIDLSWDGDLDHEYVKSMIINEEFNIVRSKYISIDTIYDVTKLANDVAYFYNILYDYYEDYNVKLEEALTLFIPSLSSNVRFRLTDVFCYLFALTYIFNGIEDTIMNTQGKILHVNGFNFKTNLSELARYVEEKGFTMEELGVADFIKPTVSISSYNQLLEIFVKNSKIRDHLIDQMEKADNKRIYDIYKYLYDALMVSEFNNEYFKDPTTGIMPKTYTDYLKGRNTTLFLSLEEIKAIDDKDVKVQRISSIVNNIVYALDEYIDSTTYKYLYSNLPSVSADHVKNYIAKVINFFKSYKIDMLGIDTVYKFDDKLDNLVRAIDDIFIEYKFHKDETIFLFESLKNTVSSSKEDRYNIIDRIYMDISTWVYKNFKELNASLKKDIISLLVKRSVKDNISIEEKSYLISKLNKDTYLELIDMISLISTSSKSDTLSLKEHLNKHVDLAKTSLINITDRLIFNLYTDLLDQVYQYDICFKTSETTKSETINMDERLYIMSYTS